MLDYSQFGEGKFLVDYFTKIKPKYSIIVDVGAKGLVCSNSANLIELGWKGFLFEPNETNFNELKEIYKENNKVKVFNVAVSDECGFGYLYIHKIKGHHSLIKPSNKKVICRLIPLSYVLKLNKVPLDFDILDIDAEEMDYRILSDILNKSFYRPKVILVEKGRGKYPFDELVSKYNYKRIFETKGNYIYDC